MRFTVNEMYDILRDYCGVSEEFISGAVAVGGFTKETMDNVAYYKSGYKGVEFKIYDACPMFTDDRKYQLKCRAGA